MLITNTSTAPRVGPSGRPVGPGEVVEVPDDAAAAMCCGAWRWNDPDTWIGDPDGFQPDDGDGWDVLLRIALRRRADIVARAETATVGRVKIVCKRCGAQVGFVEDRPLIKPSGRFAGTVAEVVTDRKDHRVVEQLGEIRSGTVVEQWPGQMLEFVVSGQAVSTVLDAAISCWCPEHGTVAATGRMVARALSVARTANTIQTLRATQV